MRDGDDAAGRPHGADRFEHVIAGRDDVHARMLERLGNDPLLGFLIETRCGHDDALEAKRSISRLTDQVRAIEQQPHARGVGLLRELTIRADDAILTSGDDLHS
jgi:hypothetical protein